MKITNNLKKYILFAIGLIILVALDLITKTVFDGKIMDFINGFIGIVGTAHNYGAGFSLFENAIVFFVILAVIFIGLFIFYEYKTRNNKKHYLYYVGTGLVLGGTIGNAIDRVVFGYVRDFINFEFFDFPIFNLADVWLTIGVIIIAIYILFLYEKDEKINKTTKEDKCHMKKDNTKNAK
jgi:signal peptidase II